MSNNLAENLNRESSRAWSNSLKEIDLKLINKDAVKPEILEKTAELRLITRSGFEQKHIFTSQIASW